MSVLDNRDHGWPRNSFEATVTMWEKLLINKNKEDMLHVVLLLTASVKGFDIRMLVWTLRILTKIRQVAVVKGVEEVIVFYDKKHNISSINSQAQGLLFISIKAWLHRH